MENWLKMDILIFTSKLKTVVLLVKFKVLRQV